MRKYDAYSNLDGIAERIDATQDSAAAVSGANADVYNPTRTTDMQVTGFIVRVRAPAANSGKVHLCYGVSSLLTADNVIAQSTTVLSAGDEVELFFPGGSDSTRLVQYAGDAASQAVKFECFEARNRR